MKLSKHHFALLQCGPAFALWPSLSQDSSRIRLAVHNYGKSVPIIAFSAVLMLLNNIESDSGSFAAREMLDPKSRKPELYELALTDLKKLGKESTCHQVATKLYMSSCQLFQEFESHGEGSLATRGPGRLQDYIDSFAISRAICDLETAHAAIPHVCESFQELALLRVIDSKGDQGLEISHEKIRHCMKGLHSDQKSWTSYNSNRDSAALLCRASRLDIDKDDFISTAQAIVNILREVKLADEQRKSDQVRADLAAIVHFQNVRDQVSDIKDRFFGLWNQVSGESLKMANVLMESLRKASGDVEATNSAMKRILTSLMEGNAEHALAQENAILATSSLAFVAEGATSAVVEFRRLMKEVGLNVTEMGVALATMEQRHTEAIDEQDTHVRELLKDVREELQDVKRITSQVKADTENTALWISNWVVEILQAGPWGISWPLLIVSPSMMVAVVGYGIPASYKRNIGLSVIGILVAKFLSLATHARWSTNAMTASSLSQLARNSLLSSIVAIPAEFELGDSSNVLGSHSSRPHDI